MLKTLLSVAQNILADITQVNIQLSVKAIRIGQCRIHQPELDIFDIRLLKIRIVQTSHNTAPTLFWIRQLTVRIDFARTNIILSALFRIVTQVQQTQTDIFIRCRLSLCRINLFLQNDTRTVVAQCIKVIFNMCRSICLRITEYRIYVEPVNQSPVSIVPRVVAKLRILITELIRRRWVVWCRS